MPALACPRCQRPNPDNANYCHFDGVALKAGQADGAANRLLQEFAFPGGRRCRTFDELALACQEDWAGARELLRQGKFASYFAAVGRLDLAKAAQESMAQANPDMGLSNLLSNLPVSRAQGPRLDLHPRRIVLGTVPAGEQRQVPLVISNQGQGLLQGTVTVAEGGEWLRVGGSNNGQCSVETPREQQVMLQVDTRGLAAGQPYGARLTVVTNGGVVEVPARLDVAPHAFARPPFQGVKTPRELAERMRAQPKAAVPLLESGEIGRWFESNGWNYPVRGVPAKGVAGVQQFFESMGLSKPPTVQLSQTEARHTCTFPETSRGQVVLQTNARKWVYANIESDAPWLQVLTPTVSGPQQAQILYEVQTRQMPASGSASANLTVHANSGQKLTLQVRVDLFGHKPTLARRLLQPVITCTLAMLLLRLALVPVVDLFGRGWATHLALERALPEVPAEQLPAVAWGGWLKLPWPRIWFDGRPEVLDDLLGPAPPIHVNRTRDFRDYFTGSLVLVVVLCTFWIVSLLGAILVWRRGSVLDAPWGLVAGTAGGLAIGATLGSAVLVLDLPLHLVWDWLLREHSGSFGYVLLWSALAVVWWTVLGAALGVALTFLGPVGRPFLFPFQFVLSGLFWMVGLRRLSEFFAPL
jgi:hypothetical protein